MVDVLVIDLTLPDIDGFQVWAGARRSPVLTAIAIAAFDDDRQRSRRLSAAILAMPLPYRPPGIGGRGVLIYNSAL